ncbi:MAG TPA: peptidyl-tRNA hydrolase Pth2 [Candidatus Thermoplasmatota archaeon]|nr:peptidyl-tRNA hydrolase Pth2 [Candidatus Thermoplasmatota archaeon]
MVIAVRKDVKMGPGKIAAQVGHACVNLALMERNQKRRAFRDWLDEGQGKVVVKVGSLKELYELKETAEARDLPTTVIQDAGKTQIEPGTVTVLGIGPGASKDLDPITGHLPLL